MGNYPDRCPSCKEPNKTNLHYCAVCGAMFQRVRPIVPIQNSKRGAMSKEQKLKVKKLKKKKELIELYKNKKINTEQFTKGMAKLGYATDIEKAMEFKKYIREQIKAFEKMDVSGVNEGEYHFDPNESQAQLPRDEFGNVITDFSVSPTPASIGSIEHETYTQAKLVSSQAPQASTSSGGPVFGKSLFSSSGPSRSKTPRKEIPKAKLKRDIPSGKKVHHRRRDMDLDWDEDEEEEEESIEEEEEDFVIDLDEEDFEGEKGWWDDEEWELDWSDEDEDDWEDWEIDLDEEDEWEMWEDEDEEEEEDELPPGIRVDFEDDEEEEDEDVFDPRTYYDDDEEDEDEEWDEPRRRRRR